MGNRAFLSSPAYLISTSFIDLINIIQLLMVYFCYGKEALIKDT